MKKDLVSFVAVIGLVLLVSAVILGALTGMLFVFPDMTILGAKAVNERDTEIVFCDDDLTAAFAQGRFILESTGAQIEVKMSNEGYVGEGTIVVRESATGIAFNSLSRTLIQWTQTIYNDLPYYKIKVLEPSGVVFNDKPTTVFINLPHRSASDTFVHDFVLQNNYSNVNFSYVDNSVGQSDALKIGDLVVVSAASVNIPSGQNVSLQSVEIVANKTKFVCQAPVSGDVKINGSDGEQVFNADINGSLKITGRNNNFRGDSAGDTEFIGSNGSLSMNEVKSLEVISNAKIDVGTVESGVEMSTESGSLNVKNVLAGGVTFSAGRADNPIATASVSGEKIKGAVVVDNYGNGAINFVDVDGAIEINNYGTGAVSLTEVDGDVYVKSSEVGGGNINVSFKNKAENCNVTIRGYDGNINVEGINGSVDIEVRNWENGAGAANITAHFNKVIGTNNVIKAGGYVSGQNDWGNVDLKLNTADCNSFNLYVYDASSANSAERYGFHKNNMSITKKGEAAKANTIKVSTVLTTGAVHVYCKKSVYLV